MQNMDFIDKVLKSVEKYYDTVISREDKADIKRDIRETVLNSVEGTLPKEFNIMYNGEILKGTLANISTEHLIHLRNHIDKEVFTYKDWENILINENLAFCRENCSIYKGINADVADYLYRHSISSRIYDIISSGLYISNVSGNTVEVYDMYIKREKSITAKKYVLGDDIELKHTISVDNPYWALYYVQDLVHKPKVRSITQDIETLIKKKARYHNIIEDDIIYRYEHGVKLDDAINMGIDEAHKYGFKYLDKPSSYNFIRYIQYLNRKEIENGEYKQ